MCAGCSATLENADTVRIVVTRILPVIQSILLVANLPRNLALTIKTMEIASMETTAAFLTQMVMLQKSPLSMGLLTMLEVVVAVEEGEEVE